MVTTAYHLLRTARPRQWLKNVAVFAPLIFSGLFFHSDGLYFFRVLGAYVVFCVLSSSVYIVNDIVDRESDRQHPFKRKRPIAAGLVSVELATLAAAIGFFVAITTGFMLSPFFVLVILGYIALQVLYSLVLKHIAILDILSIAAGFILRIYAGAVVVNLHMSVWFLLTVISASLFIAVGKRQSERTLLTGLGEKQSFKTRKSLEKYSLRLLDIYTGMFANATWLTYALFAFQYESQYVTSGPLPTLLSFVPRAFTAQKWLMITVPLVIYGVMRYLQLVYEDNQGESPERVLLRDKSLLAAVVAWGLLVMIVIYALE